MTTTEIKRVLALRGCSFAQAEGKFALVYPHGYEPSARSHELLATTLEAAVIEAWLWLHPESAADASVRTILTVVGDDFGVHPDTLLSRARHEPVATARRVAMALARGLTAASTESLGDFFCRTHSTILYGVESVAAQCATERAFAARVGTLRVACSAALIAAAEGSAG